MTPGEVRIATLRIDIPANEGPGYYGFELFAASALGNFSVSSTIVVNVTANHDLSLSHSTGETLLPGGNTTSIVEINSLSTADGNWTWGVLVGTGDCEASLPVVQTMVQPNTNTTLEVVVSASANSVESDECEITVSASLDEDPGITESIEFTLIVGQQWALSMVLPENVSLEVNNQEDILVLINNDGTETDDLLLIADDVDGLTITTPGPISLARGESQYVSVSLEADSTLSGDVDITFQLSSSNSGVDSVSDSMTVMVSEFSEFSISGPSDNRVVLIPGEPTNLTLALTSSGSANLTLSPSSTGVPGGISLTFDESEYALDSGGSVNAILLFNSGNGLPSGQTSISISFGDGEVSESLVLDLFVEDRMEVSIASSTDRIVASSIADSNFSMMLTNLGTGDDTYVIELDGEDAEEWFTLSLSSLSTSILAGESDNVILTVRQVASGAPSVGIDAVITITSTTDSSVGDSLTVTLVAADADGMITIMSDDDQAEPGQVIYGTVIITNIGTSTDSMLITTLELDCGLDHVVELGPSESSIPIDWACTIPEGSTAGVDVLTFRLTSSVRSDMIVTESEAYTIQPVWSSSGVVSIDVSNTDVDLGSNEDRTVDVTVCNEANTHITGKVEVIGVNTLSLHSFFVRVGEENQNSTYSLGSLGCQEFKLYLTAYNLNDTMTANLIVQAVSQVESATITDKSSAIHATVQAPEGPPEGINFGMFELDNQASMMVLAAGWILASLLYMWIRIRKPVEEEEEEEELAPLAENEVRINSNNKVECCACEALLGVPRGSEPPFKFTCPKCSVRIRVVE